MNQDQSKTDGAAPVSSTPLFGEADVMWLAVCWLETHLDITVKDDPGPGIHKSSPPATKCVPR